LKTTRAVADLELRNFLLGFAGSCCVEVVILYKYFVAGRRLPKRYSRWAFWVVRAGLAGTGGLLAWAYAPSNDILALNIGAAAPAIIDNVFHKIPPEQ
jgi:hypothetical protein